MGKGADMPLTEFTKYLVQNKYFLDIQEGTDGIKDVFITRNKVRVASIRGNSLTIEKNAVMVPDTVVRTVCSTINLPSPV